MMRQSVLIRVMGNIGDAVCAEPAIREHLKKNQHLNHFIQCRSPELYTDYPGICGAFHIEDAVCRKSYTHYRSAKPDWKHHIVDYLALALRLNLTDRLPDFSFIKNEDLSELRIPFKLDSNVIAVSVNPSNPIRDWPRVNWLKLTDALRAKGFKVIHLGANEEPLENADLELINKTSLRQSMTILRRIKLLIAIDSGLSHLAPAVGTPCVTLFGPVDPAIRVHAGRMIPVHSGACTHCFPTYRGIKRCPLRHHKCMRKLSVDQVLQTAGLIVNCQL